MKNILIYIGIISIFSFNSFAQNAKMSRIDKQSGTTQKDPDTLIEGKPNSSITVKSYHVEENINMKFGGSTLTYEVTDLKLINKYDLGPNNTRVITPHYKEIEQPISIPMENSKIFKKEVNPIMSPDFKEVKFPVLPEPTKTVDSVQTKKYVYVHLIKTYERIAEKGYKSVEIFKKLGDTYFFDEQYAKAAKWYGELFRMDTNLDALYYDRYAHCLKVIGEKEKASEIIKKRDQLFGFN